MSCSHFDRPNVMSLPCSGDPHMCRECWDKNVQPGLDALPKEPLCGRTYQRICIGAKQNGAPVYEQEWIA